MNQIQLNSICLADSWAKEIPVLHKKVMTVAIASILFFGMQFGLSMMTTGLIVFTASVVTYFSEGIRKEGNDWLSFDFSQRKVIVIATLIFLKTWVVQLLFYAYGIPLPVPAQEGIVQLIIAAPWKMIQSAGFIAPFVEEVLFRGFLLERIEDLFYLCNRRKILNISETAQKKIANFAQSIIFGVLHLRGKIREGHKAALCLSISGFGWFMGKMKQIDHSLIPSITYHSSSNLSAISNILLNR